MNFTSSPINKDDHNERVERRENNIFDRFLSSVKTRRLINESTSDFIAADKDHLIEAFTYECYSCLKLFASKYGFNSHINMHHSNQSILCSDCQMIFRSHRARKNHQQRFHFNYSHDLPNYNYISSYLIVPFSTEQFSLMAKNACEQGRLPLGQLTSKLFSCDSCHLSFPCSNALKSHRVNQHEQYEYKLCRTILYDMIVQVEEIFQTTDDDDSMESIQLLLSKQASAFGLIDKRLARDIRCMKHEQNHRIFPVCQHQNRTCANLCLEHLSSYHKLIENYSSKIPTVPKGNPFVQGSIVAKPTIGSLINPSIISKDGGHSQQKHSSLKRVKSAFSDRSSSSQSKRRLLEQQPKINEIKLLPMESSSTSPKKILSKINPSYTRSLSSMSSNSSSSKHSRQQTGTSLKRSISPTITLAVERSSEKRRRQREQRKAKASVTSSDIILRLDDDIEQENDDDDVDNDIVTIKYEQPKKQRQASNSSVEYVQIINNDQQSISSLNNIENLKLNSKIDEKEVIVGHSSSSVKKVTASANEKLSKTLVNGHQTSEYDEHVRVRCKICGDILEGRSRFSKHVLAMHSHLLKNNISDIKQQQTAIVR